MKKEGKDTGVTVLGFLVIVLVALFVALAAWSLLGEFGSEVGDTRRLTNIDHLQIALEKYYENCGAYPEDLSDDSMPEGRSASCSVNLLTFLNSIPTDPVTFQPYIYDVSRNGQMYCLAAELSEVDNPKANASEVVLPRQISCGGDYIVTGSGGN